MKLYFNDTSGFEIISLINIYPSPHDVKIVDLDNDNENEITGVDGGIPGTKTRFLIFKKDSSNSFQLTYSQWIK